MSSFNCRIFRNYRLLKTGFDFNFSICFVLRFWVFLVFIWGVFKNCKRIAQACASLVSYKREEVLSDIWRSTQEKRILRAISARIHSHRRKHLNIWNLYLKNYFQIESINKSINQLFNQSIISTTHPTRWRLVTTRQPSLWITSSTHPASNHW